MAKIKGKITPTSDRILITDMEFGTEKTNSGIFIPSGNGKTSGIYPRWGKVWAVGPLQTKIKPGDWILLEHGRWTRTWEIEHEDGILEVRGADNKAIMCVAEEKPSDVMRAV